MISSNNLGAVIYEDLRAQLIVGKLEPGDALSIRKLADQYNVSTMPIREALKRLETENALVGAAKKAYRVPQLSSIEASNLFFIRSVLEGAAAEIAAGRLSEQELDAARRHTMMMDAAWKQRNPSRYLENNFAFHSLVYRAANNADLSRLVEGLYARSGPFLGKAIRHLVNINEWETKHDEILEALKQHDGASAKQLIEEDIRWGALLYDNHTKQVPPEHSG